MDVSAHTLCCPGNQYTCDEALPCLNAALIETNALTRCEDKKLDKKALHCLSIVVSTATVWIDNL